jgi:hypothetical protein
MFPLHHHHGDDGYDNDDYTTSLSQLSWDHKCKNMLMKCKNFTYLKMCSVTLEATFIESALQVYRHYNKMFWP